MVSRFTYSEMRCTFRNKAYFNDALRYFQNAGTETRDSVRPAVLQPRKASRVRLFIYSERFERSSLHEYNIRRFRGCGSEGSARNFPSSYRARFRRGGGGETASTCFYPLRDAAAYNAVSFENRISSGETRNFQTALLSFCDSAEQKFAGVSVP